MRHRAEWRQSKHENIMKTDRLLDKYDVNQLRAPSVIQTLQKDRVIDGIERRSNVEQGKNCLMSIVKCSYRVGIHLH